MADVVDIELVAVGPAVEAADGTGVIMDEAAFQSLSRAGFGQETKTVLDSEKAAGGADDAGPVYTLGAPPIAVEFGNSDFAAGETAAASCRGFISSAAFGRILPFPSPRAIAAQRPAGGGIRARGARRRGAVIYALGGQGGPRRPIRRGRGAGGDPAASWHDAEMGTRLHTQQQPKRNREHNRSVPDSSRMIEVDEVIPDHVADDHSARPPCCPRVRPEPGSTMFEMFASFPPSPPVMTDGPAANPVRVFEDAQNARASCRKS